MRRGQYSLLTVLILSSLMILGHNFYSFAADDSPVKIKRIAVVEFNSDDAKLAKMLSEWTVSVLMERKDCAVVERILLKKVLDEQKLSTSGLVNKSTTTKIGELYGASHLMIGTMGKVGRKYLVTVKTVKADSAETVESNRGSTSELDNVPELLASILNGKVSYQDQNNSAISNSADMDRPSNEHDIEGNWKGFFQYDDPQRGYVKGIFNLNLRQDENGFISGEVNEPWSQGFPQQYRTFHSSIENAGYDQAKKRIKFTKRYDFDGHTVDYRGTIVSSNVMTGRWSIGSYTGSWRAVKSGE